MAARIETGRESGCRPLLRHTGPFIEAAQAPYVNLGNEATTPSWCAISPAAPGEWPFLRLPLDGANS